MTMYNKLEILHHHASKGPVWDGDQISKQVRNDLISEGYLKRSSSGFTDCTVRGLAFAFFLSMVYHPWTWIRKWRWSREEA